MDVLDFIKKMFDNADTLHHFKLCQRCTLSFLSRVPSPIDPEIGRLFYFIMEMFVKKACPNFSIDNLNEVTIWEVEIMASNRTQLV
mmetsp:Transcript_3484/g.3225  ORF Transcript_3484/g.3225 Transcript_3484/m.3225 type:complete len:86 (-) Transcript_3484:93-350(-)